jgi:hypothetical protein
MTNEEARPDADRERAHVLPPEDRGEDVQREAVEEGMSVGGSRPLTREEREAAEGDPGVPERVYAPASARVPKPPAPGDEKFVKRDEDAHTP